MVDFIMLFIGLTSTTYMIGLTYNYERKKHYVKC